MKLCSSLYTIHPLRVSFWNCRSDSLHCLPSCYDLPSCPGQVHISETGTRSSYTLSLLKCSDSLPRTMWSSQLAGWLYACSIVCDWFPTSPTSLFHHPCPSGHFYLTLLSELKSYLLCETISHSQRETLELFCTYPTSGCSDLHWSLGIPYHPFLLTNQFLPQGYVRILGQSLRVILFCGLVAQHPA